MCTHHTCTQAHTGTHTYTHTNTQDLEAEEAAVAQRDSTSLPSAAPASDIGGLPPNISECLRPSKRQRILSNPAGISLAVRGQQEVQDLEQHEGDFELPCSQGTRSAAQVGLTQALDRAAGAASGANSVAAGGVGAGQGASNQQQQQHAQHTQQCEHPSYWAGMCVCCGALKPEDGEAAFAAVAGEAEARAAAQEEAPGTGRFKAAGRRRHPARPSPKPPLNASSAQLAAKEGVRAGEVGAQENAPAATTAAAGVGAAAGVRAGAGTGAAAAAAEAGAAVPAVPPSRKTAQVPGQRKQLQSGSAAGPAVAQQQAEPLTQIRHLHARGHMEVRVCSSGDFTGSLILWVIPQNWEGALSERH